MKKNLLSLLGICLFSALTGFSQKAPIDVSNARDGENVEYCITHKKMNSLLLNPAAVQVFIQDEITRQHENANGAVPKGIVHNAVDVGVDTGKISLVDGGSGVERRLLAEFLPVLPAGHLIADLVGNLTQLSHKLVGRRNHDGGHVELQPPAGALDQREQ